MDEWLLRIHRAAFRLFQTCSVAESTAISPYKQLSFVFTLQDMLADGRVAFANSQGSVSTFPNLLSRGVYSDLAIQAAVICLHLAGYASRWTSGFCEFTGQRFDFSKLAQSRSLQRFRHTSSCHLSSPCRIC